MPETTASHAPSTNPLVEMIEALSNRQGQVDVRLEKFAVKLPYAGEVELTGNLTVSVHLRELTDRERKAHEGRQVRNLSG